MRIAVLGAGAMGQRLALNLKRAGHDVVIYNRSPMRAAALAGDGLTIAATPRAAVADADAVLAIVRDDEASRFVWFDPLVGAVQALRPNALAIECTTISPAWSEELASSIGKQGRRYACAPIIGSRPQAESRQLVSFVGGDFDAVERALPVLKDAGCAAYSVPSARVASTLKLVANNLFGIQVLAVAEVIAFLRRTEVDTAAAFALLEKLPVMSPAARAAAQLMLEDRTAPMYPIELVAKDYGYIAQMAEDAAADVPLALVAATWYSRAARTPLREANITAILSAFDAEPS